ncbi:MAG: hypothetical protein ACKOQ3_13595 [Novosphingobium sp.]
MIDDEGNGPEQVPGLDPRTLETPQRVQVRYDVKLDSGRMDFILVDTTPWPPGSHEHAVGKDANGNYCLLVERGQDRIFEIRLGDDVEWTWDPDSAPGRKGMTVKKGNPALYDAEVTEPGLMLLSAKARPNPPAGGAEDQLNFFVKMGQSSGLPISIRIDPGTKNPPP